MMFQWLYQDGDTRLHYQMVNKHLVNHFQIYSCLSLWVFCLFFFFPAVGSKIKLQVTLKGISNVQCNHKYRRHNLTFKENQMCAGGEKGSDSCRGI